MKNENNAPKMAKLTRTQDLNLTNDILSAFLEGESHPEEMAVGLLQYILDKHNILDEKGIAMVANLENFRLFGIKGIRSNFIDHNNKIIPIFVIIQMLCLLRSPDWSKS